MTSLVETFELDAALELAKAARLVATGHVSEINKPVAGAAAVSLLSYGTYLAVGAPPIVLPTTNAVFAANDFATLANTLDGLTAGGIQALPWASIVASILAFLKLLFPDYFK